MTSRDKRALLIGTVVVALAWVTTRAAPDLLRSIAETESRIDQRADLLARSTQRLERLDALDDSIESLERVAESLPRVLLAGHDAGTAAIDLMGRIRAHVDTDGTSLREFGRQAVTSRQGSLALLELEAVLASDFRGLVAVMASLAQDSTVAIERVAVRATNPHDHGSSPERLDVTMSVSGWFLDGEVEPTDPQGAVR